MDSSSRKSNRTIPFSLKFYVSVRSLNFTVEYKDHTEHIIMLEDDTVRTYSYGFFEIDMVYTSA